MASLNVTENESRHWKVIVIHELDKLSKEAQSGLRRTMEKYMHNCRIIFTCESLSRVLPPLKSRCYQIRVPAPKFDDVTNTLLKISKEENFDLGKDIAEKISNSTKRNMRKAICTLQALRSMSSNIKKMNIPKAGYEEVINEICDMIINEQTPKQLRNIRSRFYELLTKGIGADIIFVLMIRQLLPKYSNESKLKLLGHSVDSDFRCKQGQKDIIHLESFAALSMMAYRGK